jgi:hypothetical protein
VVSFNWFVWRGFAGLRSRHFIGSALQYPPLLFPFNGPWTCLTFRCYNCNQMFIFLLRCCLVRSTAQNCWPKLIGDTPVSHTCVTHLCHTPVSHTCVGRCYYSHVRKNTSANTTVMSAKTLQQILQSCPQKHFSKYYSHVQPFWIEKNNHSPVMCYCVYRNEHGKKGRKPENYLRRSDTRL